MKLPVIGITAGDPSGIGSEIIVKTLHNDSVYKKCVPLVIGSFELIQKTARFVQCDRELRRIGSREEMNINGESIFIYDINNVAIGTHEFGSLRAEYGRAAVEYIEKAHELITAGFVDATCSAPLNKEAMHLAGFSYAGQTELFGRLTGSRKYALMIIAGHVKLFYVTNHISLRKVPDCISKERVLDKIMLFHESLKEFGSEHSPLYVAALNPHAGEGGVLGDEEVRSIIPAVQEARNKGIDVHGPFPADALWMKVKQGECDAVLGMYHDQVNIAQKLLGFGVGITFEVGLPYVRTSVMHGTAFDITGKGMADESTFTEALITAAELAQKRMSA